MPWHRLLVLGGIGSDRAGFADSVLADQPGVRRVAPDQDADPARLAGRLGESKPDQTLLVTGLDDWLPARTDPAAAAATLA
ncbi:MAG: hypothetical protein ACRDT2_23530, partial [Natronosporangium sp.]